MDANPRRKSVRAILRTDGIDRTLDLVARRLEQSSWSREPTAIIWVSYAKRDIDLMTRQGHAVPIFIAITSFVIPQLFW